MAKTRDAATGRGPGRSRDLEAEQERRRTWWGALAGTVGAVALAVAVAAGGNGTTPGRESGEVLPTPGAVMGSPQAPMTCPATVRRSETGGRLVTSPPAEPQGFDGAARLVPDATPTSVVVCRYADVTPLTARSDTTSAIESRLESETRPAALDPALLERWAYAARVPGRTWVHMCTLIGGPTVPYLVGLDYGDGRRAWVAGDQDPNNCSPSTNGSYLAAMHLGDPLRRITTRKQAPGQEGCLGGMGRLGSDTALVPPGVTGATVCDRKPPRQLSSEEASRLAEIFGGPGVRPYGEPQHCTPTKHGMGRVAFHYDRGPDVQVMWSPNCSPQAMNLLVVRDRIDITAVEAVVGRLGE